MFAEGSGDLRAVSAPCQPDAYPTFSHRGVGRGVNKNGELDTRAVMCTSESPAHGDHCNANARLEFLLGGDFYFTFSSCMFVFDSVPSRTWLLLWLGRLVRVRRNTVRHECDARNKRILSALSLAVRSAIDVGRWADFAAVVSKASASAVLADRIAKHSLCDVGLVHVPVAVFQLAEYEQTVTTVARFKKFDLNFRDPEPETEELIANRDAAHILKKQDDEWTEAKQQRDVQRVRMLWCEGAGAYLCEGSQQVLGNRKKAQSGRGQVRLKTQRRRATASIAHEGAKNHPTRRLLKLAWQV